MYEYLVTFPLPGSGNHRNFDELRACSKNMNKAHYIFSLISFLCPHLYNYKQ